MEPALPSLMNFLVIVAIIVLIFVFIRAFWLWYFQIQERTNLMKEQNEILKAIFKQLGGNIDDTN